MDGRSVRRQGPPPFWQPLERLRLPKLHGGHKPTSSDCKAAAADRGSVLFLRRMIWRWTEWALGTLVPQRCGGCGIAFAGPASLRLCGLCASLLPDLRGPVGQLLCAERIFVPWARVGLRLRGAPEVRTLVHTFKYGGDGALAVEAGRWLASGEPPDLGDPLLVPIPVHLRRRLHRGYNQAERIAAGIRHVWHWPLEPRGLVRTSHRASITGSGRRNRAQTLRSCFAPGRGLRGRKVVLVDDVLTTGATVRAASEAVEAGGGQVVGLAVLVLS